MRTPKLILVGLLLTFLAANKIHAQQSIPDCADIKVEVKATNPALSGSNGIIELVFGKPVSNYKIIWLNAGSDKTEKEEVADGKINNLRAGFYDLLIMDKNKQGCIRQLTVTLK